VSAPRAHIALLDQDAAYIDTVGQLTQASLGVTTGVMISAASKSSRRNGVAIDDFEVQGLGIKAIVFEHDEQARQGGDGCGENLCPPNVYSSYDISR
jgi:hypothetical protein